MTTTEALDQTATPWRRFVGSNIKGTPAMPAAKVAEDLETLRDAASIAVTQEFRWPWYWRAARRVLRLVRRVTKTGDPKLRRISAAKWKTAPPVARAIVAPVFSAQAVMWRGRDWRRARTMHRRLHDGAAKISETREIRAALLVDWITGLAVWAGTTHFVVGGDKPSDRRRHDFGERRRMLLADLDVLDAFLGRLVATGHAVILELDANIGLRSEQGMRDQLIEVIHRHGGRIYGDRGVEWLIVIDGREVAVEVRNPRTIQPKTHGGPLNTDHEARVIAFRLVRTLRG